MFAVNKEVTYERGYRIPTEKTIYEYLSEHSFYDDILSGDKVIVISRRQKSFALNVVGGIIFESIESGEDIDKIMEKLLTVFKVRKTAAEAELEYFILELLNNDIIYEI